jgi:hypothetical protein
LAGSSVTDTIRSVSALMFDYILTGPINGVSAGLYLTGLLNELLRHAHSSLVLPMNWTAAFFAALVTIYSISGGKRSKAFPNRARQLCASCTSPPSWWS